MKEEPAFRTPVLVMTHHMRPSFTLSDTMFHFVNGSPATVLQWGAGSGAGHGRPARQRGTIIRQFLDADLVGTMHVAVSPVKLGPGLRL